MSRPCFEQFKLWLVRGLIAVCFFAAVFSMLSGCAGTGARSTAQEHGDTKKIAVVREMGSQTVFRLNHLSGQLQPEERREWHQEQEMSERTQHQHRTTHEASTAFAVTAPNPAGLLPSFLGGFGAETALGGLASLLAWLWWKTRDQRNQLIKSVEYARDVLPDDVDQQFTAVLAAHQDRDVKKVVQKYTA